MINDEVLQAGIDYLRNLISRDGKKIKIMTTFFFPCLHGGTKRSLTYDNYDYGAVKR